MGDIVTRHGGQEADGAVDIGAVVFQRYLARFTYGLESGEVYHAVNVWMRVEDPVEVFLFPHIDLKEIRPLAADELDAIDGFFGGVEEVVRDDDFVVCFE